MKPNERSKSKKRIHGFRICGTNADFYHHANETLKDLNVNENIEDLIHVTDSYVGGGYGETWPELKELILDVAETTGIFLDRVYTGKAIYGRARQNKKNLIVLFRIKRRTEVESKQICRR